MKIISKLTEKICIVTSSVYLISMYMSFLNRHYDKALEKAITICLRGMQLDIWDAKRFHDDILCGANDKMKEIGRYVDWKLQVLTKFAIEMGL